MAHGIVHWEIMGADGNKLAAWYSDLFGWKTSSPPGFDGYHLVDQEETGTIGGAVGQGSDKMPSYLTIYIEVESINDHLAQIEAGGGQVVMPRTELPGVVTFAMFTDPAGNMVGLVEADVPAAE